MKAAKTDTISREFAVARAIADAQDLTRHLVLEFVTDGYFGQGFTRSHLAALELFAALDRQAQIDEILTPIGPALKAQSLHNIVWGPAARLWDRFMPSRSGRAAELRRIHECREARACSAAPT